MTGNRGLHRRQSRVAITERPPALSIQRVRVPHNRTNFSMIEHAVELGQRPRTARGRRHVRSGERAGDR